MKYFLNLIIILYFQTSVLKAMYDGDQILKEVDVFLNNEESNLNYEINKRIKIPSCIGKIKINKKYDSLKTLEILCLGEKPWKYNLRTNISVKHDKKKYKKNSKKKKIGIVVSVRNLKKDHLIQEGDVKVKYLNHTGSNNTFLSTKNLIGRKLKLPLKEEQILRDRHLEKNWIIKEGQKVKIEHKKGNLIILVDGVALNSGMKGDYLEVKNENSGKIIKGWVKNNKKITIFR